jgi:hypothetical protein
VGRRSANTTIAYSDTPGADSSSAVQLGFRLGRRYFSFVAPVNPRTTLVELRARIRAAEARGADGSARLVRSVQQSLRVEGYDVREDVLRDALERTRAPAQR